MSAENHSRPRESRLDASRSRRPWTVRAATWSACHARAVVGLWLVATIGIFVASMAAGGMRTANVTDGSAVTEAGLAAQAMQPATGGEASEELLVVITNPAVEATAPAFRDAVATAERTLAGVTVAVGGSSLPAVASLTDPYSAPTEAGLVAPDLTSVQIVGSLQGDTAARETRARAVEAALPAIREVLPGFEVHAYSSSLLNNEMVQEINADLDQSLWISLPATFLILLLAFGALAAAGVPLVLAITALLAAFGLVGIFSQVVAPISPYASQFVVLIGLAVAVDYSLFVITRFRSERRAGREKMAAIEIASGTSGRAVLFSGMAVMISLAGLLMLPDPLFSSIAAGTIAVIAVSVVGSLTFLPAVLSWLGDGIDRGRLPFLARRLSSGSTVWMRIVRGVMAHPVAATALSAVVLLVIAAPVTRLRLGESDLTAFPNRIDCVRAVEAMRAHWPQGSLLRLNVVVVGADPAADGAISRLEPALLAIPGLSGPAQVTTSPGGSAISVSVLMAGGQNDEANRRIVDQVRSEVIPAAFGVDAARVLVGGGAAASLDQTRVYEEGIGRIFVFVLGLSFVLLLLVFHSIVIPIKALALNLLATAAAFGAMTAVFQEGVLGPVLGVQPTDVIQNFVPIFVFTALFGLSMDYEVFILASVRELVDRGLSSSEAVARGIGVTRGNGHERGGDHGRGFRDLPDASPAHGSRNSASA